MTMIADNKKYNSIIKKYKLKEHYSETQVKYGIILMKMVNLTIDSKLE